jgi:hypothetical protein
VVAAGVAGAHLANEFVLDHQSRHLNPNVEGNALTWLNSLVTLAAAGAAVALALALGPRGRRILPLAALIAFFGLDDLLAIHEDLGKGLTLFGLPEIGGAWVLLYFPLFAFAVGTLWTIAPGLAAAETMLRLGVLLLAAAVAADLFAAGVVPALGGERSGWGYELEIALEESAELAGWLLIGSGLIAASLAARLQPEAVTARSPEAGDAAPATVSG